MHTFRYVTVDAGGRRSSGLLTARDESDLEDILRRKGQWVVESQALKEGAAGSARKGRVGRLRGANKRRELTSFCSLMHFLLRCGIPLVQALGYVRDDCDDPRFRRVLQEIRELVEAGATFHDALTRYPWLFSRQFLSLVRAGEESGSLPERFEDLKRNLEWQDQMISDVRQATIYPVIVLIVVILFVLLLFSHVIPKFSLLLTAAKVPLPLTTRWVFGASNFAKETWWMWMLGAVVVPGIVILLRRKSAACDLLFDRLRFRLPVFGSLNHMLVMSRLAHNLAVLYRSGVTLLSALDICTGLVGSRLVAECLRDCRQRMEAGETLSESLKRHKIFPTLLVLMTSTGERTGSLDASLNNVAEYYTLIVPRRIKKIFAIMEPAMTLFLVGIVGLVAMSVFTPIMSMMGAARK